MSSSSLSDREKAGLSGRVETIVDDYRTTVFDRNGKTLKWRGNTPYGRVERTYVYDENERLVRVTGSDGDHDDEFRYDSRGKTQIRHIPARPDQQRGAFGISLWFDAISEGEGLTEGGTVETTYNERDQPVEKRIFDDEGMLLSRVEYLCNADGRLSEEKLINENPPLPRAFRDQIPIERPQPCSLSGRRNSKKQRKAPDYSGTPREPMYITSGATLLKDTCAWGRFART